MWAVISWDSLDLASKASRRINILPRYNSTDKICRTISTSTKVRRKTVFQFVKMIIRLLSHTFFILTFISSSAIFGYFGDLQYLEIPNFPNIRTLSLALGKGIANLRKTKSYLRLIFGLSSGKALDKWCMSKRPLAVSAVLAVLQILENRNNRNNCTLAFSNWSAPWGNLIQQPQQLVSTTFRGNQLPAAVME